MKIDVNNIGMIRERVHSDALGTIDNNTSNTNRSNNSVDDDHVTLSSTKLINSNDSLRDHDQEAVSKQRVERIRVAIEDGTYVTDPFRTAVKMMEFDRLFQ
jgi:anti-sigma28 factor (negative regulator of flagellin synthesis)